jgi:type 1 fimbriae regulatory protein FimB/type 1 fimbriae regulatory protein FimE
MGIALVWSPHSRHATMRICRIDPTPVRAMPIAFGLEPPHTFRRMTIKRKVRRHPMSNARAFRTKKSKTPTAVNRKVTPTRLPNKDLRPREYLKPNEVDRLMVTAAKLGRYGHRDGTLILLTYRHGLRVSELVALRWDQLDLQAGLLHVSRNKNGIDSVHPLRGPELRALRRLQRDDDAGSYVFMTERGGPMTEDNVRKLVQRAGKEAKLAFPVHPHMLRHACGYKLANDGHDTRSIQHYLGHKNIQHTVRYTELSPHRFRDFWRD